MKISLQKIDMNFECDQCRRKVSCGVVEAIQNGAPMCQDCDEEMDIVDCEIDLMAN